MEKIQTWGSRIRRTYLHSDSWILTMVLLLIAILLVGILMVRGEDPKDPPLTDIESTKLSLVQEKIKNQTLNAAMLKKAYEDNQKEGQQLRDQELDLFHSICKAHNIAADQCQISPDFTHLSAKAASPAPPTTKPAAGADIRDAAKAATTAKR